MSATHGYAGRRGRRPEYGVWSAMIQRCTNPRRACYADYGGRGIRVCERWRSSFVAFLADVGDRPTPQHTIDRIDNDGDYEPGNVRWTTRAAQAQNRRSRLRLLTVNGVTRCLSEWSRAVGVPYETIVYRANAGYAPGAIVAVERNRSGRRGS